MSISDSNHNNTTKEYYDSLYTFIKAKMGNNDIRKQNVSIGLNYAACDIDITPAKKINYSSYFGYQNSSDHNLYSRKKDGLILTNIETHINLVRDSGLQKEIMQGINLDCSNTTATTAVYGFINCNQLINCIATSSGFSYGSGYGFYDCAKLTNCIGKSLTSSYGYGFYNCNQLTNCTSMSKSDSFYNCNQLTNCAGTCTSDGSGFFICTQLTNCIGYGTPLGSGFSICTQLTNCTASGDSNKGFYNCIQLTNCSGTGKGVSSGSTRDGYGFYNCTQLANCAGTGTSVSGYGYSFYGCKFLNGCKEGEVLSLTGIWSGTNTFRDDSSCQLTR